MFPSSETNMFLSIAH